MSATRRKGIGLTWKVFAATALVVVAVLAIAIVTTAAVARVSAERALETGLDNAGEVTRQQVDAENAKLAAAAGVAAQNVDMRAAVLTSELSSALDQVREFGQILGTDYTLVADNQGVLRARSDQRDSAGTQLGGPLIDNALAGRQTAGFVNQNDERLYLAVATPLGDTNAVLGVLLAADQVTDTLARDITVASGSDIVFFVIDSTEHPAVVASSLPRDASLDSVLRSQVTADALSRGAERTRTEGTYKGEAVVGLVVPFINPGRDRPMGGYLALRSRDQAMAAFTPIRRTLIIVGVAGLLLAVIMSFLMARAIAGPVRLLARSANRVAEGDYSADVPVAGGDEIGQLAASFKHMVQELKAKQQLVEFLSSNAGSAATQPIYTAGGNVATPTMVRSVAGATGMLAVGQTFANRYDVKGMLGVGGMGVVYRAMDRELGEPVAIKTLKGDAMATDPSLLQRFKDEIRLARKITHRNVVRTYDLGEVEGMYYITMEFVEGQSLKHLIQSRGSLPVPVALTVGKQLCRALEVAHEQGVIHRDIKPQNLIVEPSGTLKVMDFGIARLATRQEGVTQAGMAIGTPEYMAPEQLLGENVDFRADLYAAGCVLFECLTGRPPFQADNPITLVAKQLEETPPAPGAINPDVPAALSDLILRTLSKDAAQRPQSATALHDALDAIAAQGVTEPRPAASAA